MNFLKTLAIAIMAAICVVSCKKEETALTNTTNNSNQLVDTTGLTKIGETYIIGAAAKAVVYAEKPLFVGYNKLYVAMYDSVDKSRLTNGHFELIPSVVKNAKNFIAPFEETEDTMPSAKLWSAVVVFTEASLTQSSWNLNLLFHNHKIDEEGEGTLTVNVAQSSPEVLKVVTSTVDSSTLVLSLIQPTAPKIGLNNFEVTVHSLTKALSYTAVEDYTVEIRPEMPSMGHGSPNNTNPIHTGMGHYTGKVNFTMTGLWRVYITLKKNGVVVSDSQYFDITL